jgi:hypothetical protein
MTGKKLENPIKFEEGILIPSTKLLCAGVHKIQDFQNCKRYYFYRWVLNIIPRNVNLNFWFGELVHKGVECLSLGKTLKKTLDIVAKHSKKVLKQYKVISPEMVEECRMQLEIINGYFEIYQNFIKNRVKDAILLETEKSFSIVMNKTPVKLVGTLEMFFRGLDEFIHLVEYKTAKSLTNEYFARLVFDKQIYAYAKGVKKLTGEYPRDCLYTVFKKPSIRPRQDESLDEFVKRFKLDLRVRKDFYLVTENVKYGRDSRKSVENDVEILLFDLWSVYNFYSTDNLLKYENWGKNDRVCFNYGTCPYFPLCKNESTMWLYINMFQMRELRYETEVEELDKKRACTASQLKKKFLVLGQK